MNLEINTDLPSTYSANVLTRMGNGKSGASVLNFVDGLPDYGGPDGFFSGEAMAGPIPGSAVH